MIEEKTAVEKAATEAEPATRRYPYKTKPILFSIPATIFLLLTLTVISVTYGWLAIQHRALARQMERQDISQELKFERETWDRYKKLFTGIPKVGTVLPDFILKDLSGKKRRWGV